MQGLRTGRKRKPAQGDGELRREVSPHWRGGGGGSAQRGCEQIWGGGGAQADLERLLLTEGGAGAGASGSQGVQDKQGGRRAE